MTLPHLTAPALCGLPHLRHGFFTRRGGISDGLYASLNCGPGSGDALENVGENRARVAAAIGAPLLTCRQVHSAEVVTVSAPWQPEAAPQADALVTATAGMALGVLTADCLPVLFADRQKPIIGAAHAGWKGAFSGVLENTLAAMQALGANDIIAAIGPAIAQASYEVGPEFHARFTNNQQPTSNRLFFAPSAKAEHFCFNLKAYAASRLEKAGVTAVNLLANDTCLEENDFFSFRRATLRGEPVYGRQVSVISLR
jgi:YfiH family protein